MTAVDNPQRAGRREWFGLFVLCLPTFVVAVDLFVLLLALPNLSSDLGATSNQQLWVTDIYGFLMAGFLVTMGTLGDRVGRRKLLLIGGAAFAVLSVVCAYAPSIELLIVARALLGIAGATLTPSTLALITNLFKDPKQMVAAFGMWAGIFTLGAIVGPVIGGFMLANWWWGSVFLLGVPFMIAPIILGPKFLPEFKNPRFGRLDPTSVVLSLLALLPIIYGIKQLARHGWEVWPIVALVVGLISGTLFLRRQRKLSDPLLDLTLFTNKAIGTSLTAQLSYSMVGGGIMLMMMLYFQLVDGMTSLQAGLAMVPGMVFGAIGLQVAPKLGIKYKPGYVIGGGLLAAAVVYGVLSQFSIGSGTAILIVGFAIIAFFGAPTVALGTNLVLGSAPPEKAGSAGSLAQMANEFGSTLGLAILGTIGTAVYRADLTLPQGLPSDAAAAASDSLAGATASASSLPAGTASSLLTPARDAFLSGVHAVAAVGAILFAAVGVLTAVRLRHIPPFGQAAAPPAEEAASPANEAEPNAA